MNPATPGNITGTIVDNNGNPVSSVTITVAPVSGSVAQVFTTDKTGSFAFSNLNPGSYKISAVHTQFNFNTQQQVQLDSGQTRDVPLRLDVSLATQDNRYLYLKYFQYIFLAFISFLFFFQLLGKGISELSLSELKKAEYARGIITYLIAITTVGMAFILMLSSIMIGGKDLDKRFTLGKEILTILISVLATITGFYYGSSTKEATSNENATSDRIQVENVKIKPVSPKISDPSFDYSSTLVGGTPPYSYSITVVPSGTTQAVEGENRVNGNVKETLKFLKSAKPGEAMLILSVKDKKNVTKSDSSKITLVK